MKVLISGFEAFEEQKYNPSEEALKMLPESIGDIQIIKIVLPVLFGYAADLLIENIRQTLPDAVICTGLAAGRKAVTPEMIAINLKNARIPDNAGNKPEWEKICKEGEDGLITTLPVLRMKDALLKSGIPSEISLSAGTFVCNEVMYRLLSFVKKEYPDMKAGFIHVPCAEEYPMINKDNYTLPVREIARALSICIAALNEP